MQLDTPGQLSPITVILHWVTSLFIIVLLGVGVYMAENETRSLYPLHKSIGTLILLLVIPRIIWRIKNGWPVPVGQYSVYEQWLSKIVHWVLLLGTLLMPVSGFLMSALGGHGVAISGLELVTANPDPLDPAKVLAYNAGLAEFFKTVHSLLGDIMIGAIVLHIAGALKHHVVDKDGTLLRMRGKAV